MKTILSHTKFQVFFLLIIGAYFALNSFIPRGEEEPAPRTQPVIIWNDDPESIPQEGEKIVIEFTKKDTIYIGSVEANK